MRVYKEVLYDNRVVNNRENVENIIVDEEVVLKNTNDVITIHNNKHTDKIHNLSNVQTNSTKIYNMEIDHTGCRCRLGAVPNILVSLGCNVISSVKTESGKMLQTFNYNENIQNIENYLIESGYVLSLV